MMSHKEWEHGKMANATEKARDPLLGRSDGLVHVFISDGHADRKIVEALSDHLGWLRNDNQITVFDDGQLVAGDTWDDRIKAELVKADIILLVITAKFTGSSYCKRSSERLFVGARPTESG